MVQETEEALPFLFSPLSCLACQIGLKTRSACPFSAKPLSPSRLLTIAEGLFALLPKRVRTGGIVKSGPRHYLSTKRAGEFVICYLKNKTGRYIAIEHYLQSGSLTRSQAMPLNGSGSGSSDPNSGGMNVDQGNQQQRKRPAREADPAVTCAAIQETGRTELVGAVGGMKGDIRSCTGRGDTRPRSHCSCVRSPANVLATQPWSLEDWTTYCHAAQTTQGGKVVACRNRAPSDHDAISVTFHIGGQGHKANMGTKCPPPRTRGAPALGPAVRSTRTAQKHQRGCQGHFQARESSGRVLRKQEVQTSRPGNISRRQRRKHIGHGGSIATQLGGPSAACINTARPAGRPLTDPTDWEQQLSKHFRVIFNTFPQQQEGSHPARSAAPLQASTRETIPTRRSATGSGDMGVQQKLRTRANSHDAVQAMLQYPQWSQIVLHELDDMLYKGAIHTGVGRVLTVLLPKIAELRGLGRLASNCP